MRLLMGVGLAICLALASCGDDKLAAGEDCTATPEGATECATSICLTDVSCGSKTISTACAGAPCDPNASTHDCGDEMQCVQVTGTTLGYCLPVDLCQ